jgi:hypothetical protein
MTLAKALKPKGKARKPREGRAGNRPPAKLENYIPPKIVVPSMRSSPRPVAPVKPAYLAKILIPIAIK